MKVQMWPGTWKLSGNDYRNLGVMLEAKREHHCCGKMLGNWIASWECLGDYREVARFYKEFVASQLQFSLIPVLFFIEA